MSENIIPDKNDSTGDDFNLGLLALLAGASAAALIAIYIFDRKRNINMLSRKNKSDTKEKNKS